jgi:hypothetical protein
MLAVSSSLCTRLLALTRSRTRLLRYRVRSRKSRIGGGGMKLARMRPCASRSAIHSQSFTSVFRPGTALMCHALAKTTSKLPSRRLNTGFQYTLVDSIATCVHAACDSHSVSRSNSAVVVPNRCTSVFTRDSKRRIPEGARRCFSYRIRSSLCPSSPEELLNRSASLPQAVRSLG